MTQMTQIAPCGARDSEPPRARTIFAYTLGLASARRQEQEQEQQQQPERGRSRIVGSVGEQRWNKAIDSNARPTDPLIRDHPISGSCSFAVALAVALAALGERVSPVGCSRAAR